MSWKDAQTICHDRGEQLVHIRSKSENAYIFNEIVSQQDEKWTWLGATNVKGTTTYKWLDGNELTYTNWLSGEPSRWNVNNVNKILMRPDNGQWQVYPNDGPAKVLCEKRL